MTAAFYVSGAVALLATVAAVTRPSAVRALLWLIVSLFAIAVAMYVLGGHFAAALEVIVYAGAIMVLLLFVVTMLDLSRDAIREQRRLLHPRHWIGPATMTLVLAVELAALLAAGDPAPPATAQAVTPAEVGRTLLGPYVLAVELASMLLLAAVVAAFHLARRPDGPGRAA